MNIIVTRKTMIRKFAEKMAQIQQRADHEYYKPFLKDYTPEANQNEHAAWLLDKEVPIKEMCHELEIYNEVMAEAKKIYDFTNSGKAGYTLKDGKIVAIAG